MIIKIACKGKPLNKIYKNSMQRKANVQKINVL
jgi:hypothetical protein